MAAGEKNFIIEAGSSFNYIITWKNKLTGLPIDLTGYEIKFVAKRLPTDTKHAIDLSSEEGTLQLDRPTGKMYIQLTHTKTQSLFPYYQFLIYELSTRHIATNNYRVLLKGNIEVKRSFLNG